MPQRWLALVLGLVVNAFGNGLSVASNMGTSPWTASEVNLSHWLGTSVGLAIFAVSCLAAIVNQLLLRHWDLPRLLGEISFVFFFSYFVDIFSGTFTKMGIMRYRRGGAFCWQLPGS